MKTEVVNPSVPNFIQVRVGNKKEVVTVPVQDFSEEELREIGKRWTEDLVAKGRRHSY